MSLCNLTCCSNELPLVGLIKSFESERQWLIKTMVSYFVQCQHWTCAASLHKCFVYTSFICERSWEILHKWRLLKETIVVELRGVSNNTLLRKEFACERIIIWYTLNVWAGLPHSAGQLSRGHLNNLKITLMQHSDWRTITLHKSPLQIPQSNVI